MDRIRKFYAKLRASDRKKVLAVLEELKKGEIPRELKKLKGFKDLYALRIGKIRVVFLQNNDGCWPVYVNFRKDIYRKLK